MALHGFHKMHGLGNDFVIFDARKAGLPLDSATVRQIAHRQHGIGCNQLIVMEPSAQADFFMRIYNQDGGEVEACGNATRCVTWLAGRDVTIDSAGGMLHGRIGDRGVSVDMGEPRFGWDQIPLGYAMDTAHLPLAWEMLDDPMAVNIGNPHVIFFVADSNAVDLERLGPVIEHDPVFPERVNVNVAHVGDDGVHLRVWERGVGLTLACGTGACATAVAAIRRKLASSPVTVHLPGGVLEIAWAEGGLITMIGPVAHVFTGEIDL
ncbi:MAG: diaminopimelate epimerase [Blastomonas sp.]